jgi:signal transduction histidine kinase
MLPAWLQNVDSELQQYMDLLFDFKNPIFLLMLLIFAIIGIIIIFFRQIFIPEKEKFTLEKKELEIRNVKLMALFAELDPDPVIRLNKEGYIISSNKAAQSSFSVNGKSKISETIPAIDLDIVGAIEGDQTHHFEFGINDKYYSVFFKGISMLDIGQIYFRDITERKQLEDRSRDYQEKLKEFSINLQNRIEDEKHRIARELHDGIGQSLMLHKLNLQQFLKKNIPNAEKTDISRVLDFLDMTIRDLKSISADLKPHILDDIGIIPAISSLCNKINTEAGIQGKVEVLGVIRRFQDRVEVYLYRIIQEALSNIVKHSKASEFTVQIIFDDDYLRVIISDNGAGFDPQTAMHSKRGLSGMGLMNMQERCESLSGKFLIDSSKEFGTTLILDIPGSVYRNE